MIVAHGSDTMEWTAAALQAPGLWEVPIVCFAASRRLGEATPNTSCRWALQIGEVLSYHNVNETVVSKGFMWQGGFVQKEKGYPLTYRYPEPPLGRTRSGRFEPKHVPHKTPHTPNTFTTRTVELVSCHPGLRSGAVCAALSCESPDMAMLELYFSWTVPQAALDIAATRLGAELETFKPHKNPLPAWMYWDNKNAHMV